MTLNKFHHLEFGKSVDLLNDLESKRSSLKGKKRNRFEPLHFHNKKKILRNSGQSYFDCENHLVQKKEFKQVTECCKNRCFNNFSVEDQQYLLESFWSIGDYDKQNIYLSGLMQRKNSKENCKWNFEIDLFGLRSIVCRSFLLKVIQISDQRLKVLQKKISYGESICDNRGKQQNRKKIPDIIWQKLHEFINKIPKVESHYCIEKSEKEYFDDPSLNVTLLFEGFIQVLKEENLKTISYRSFSDYFNINFNIGFRYPRTDVCNLCYKSLCHGENSLNQNEKELFQEHLKSVNEYKAIKSFILNEKNNKLILEMDYCQNKPLPKISATKSFYLRKLWLFICNIHIHNSNESFMFHFTEGEFKKGPNTIATFIYEIVKNINLESFNEMVIFSDSCFAQNKNSVVFKTLVYLSNLHNIRITQVFPQVGHSYCICDRNFANFTKKIKRIENIELPQEYLDILTKLNFNMVKANVWDFDKLFANKFNVNLNIEISKLFKICYEPNGKVNCFKDYGSNGKIFNFKKYLNSNWTSQIETEKPYFVSEPKTKDVFDLLSLLKNESQVFYKTHLNKYSINNFKNYNKN